MKLFDTFEAVKFSQENMIFITNDGYLYYIYEPKYPYEIDSSWKHKEFQFKTKSIYQKRRDIP